LLAGSTAEQEVGLEGKIVSRIIKELMIVTVVGSTAEKEVGKKRKLKLLVGS
jgi:hypothetical protein